MADQRVQGALVLIGSTVGAVSLQAAPSGSVYTIQMPGSPPAPSSILAVANLQGNTVVMGWTPSINPAGNGNLVFATPNGAPGPAVLRSLVAADIPVLSYLPSGTVLPANTPAVPHQFLTAYTAGSGFFTLAALTAPDIPNIAESQVINLVSDLAAKAPLFSPALTGNASAVNLHLTGTFADGVNSVGTPGQLLSSTGSGTAWVTAASNVPAGTNVIPMPGFAGTVQNGYANYTVFMKIPARMITAQPSSWKVVVNAAPGANSNFTAVVVMKTAKDSLSVLTNTPILFGGQAAPSLPAGFNTSDTINVAIDANHDYWLAAHMDNTSPNTNIMGWAVTASTPTGVATLGVYGGYIFTDHTSDITIPGLSAVSGIFDQILSA